jgi:hypothetical protein
MGNADDASVPSSPEENPPDDASESKTRAWVELQLEELREKLGFDGTHLALLNDPVERAKAREQRIKKTLDGDYTYDSAFFSDSLTGAPIWGQAESDALLNDRDTVDLIWLRPTVDLLVGTFVLLARADFEQWSKQRKSYRVFVAGLEPIRLAAIKECRAVWPGRDPTWVDRIVVPNAVAQLESAKRDWREKARAAELAHTESKYQPTEEEKRRSAEIDRLVKQGREQIQPDRDDNRHREAELRHAEALAEIEIEATRKKLELEREAAGSKFPPAPEAEPHVPARTTALAEWLNGQLNERNWTIYEPYAHNGPTHKTIQKILNGGNATPRIRTKLVLSLSSFWKDGKQLKITLDQIPPNPGKLKAS